MPLFKELLQIQPRFMSHETFSFSAMPSAGGGVFFYDGYYLAVERTLFGTKRQDWGLMVKVCLGLWGYKPIIKNKTLKVHA